MPLTIRGWYIGHEGYSNGTKTFLSGPNSAGGVSVKGTIVNTDPTRVIKYISLYFIPYNSVNDPVQCTIKHVSEYGLQITGPINANGGVHSFYGENMWYNHSISQAIISRAEIEYMDGTTESLKGSEITFEQPKSGCYVATAVYGSYDCPEVWTLRRYRDTTLASTWYGRAFVHTYYAVSPTLVKWFGKTEWFKRMWRGKLDRMVTKLNAEGVENTPYNDRNW